MAEIQEIDVFVKPDGTVKLEVRGAKGKKCLDLTKDMEELLGADIAERIYTDEFDQAEEQQTEAESVEQKF